MDDLYPSMNIHYKSNILTIAQVYLYISVALCIILILRFIFVKEQYRYIKRKNTEDSPIMSV
jgi:hypothetical protein